MSYHALYEHVQRLNVHIPRNQIKNKILEVSGLNRIALVASGLDPVACRGFYVSPQNLEHPLVKQFGCHVIVAARGLNRCWTRIVLFKEMMHIFDESIYATDSGDKFETVLTELSVGLTSQTSSAHKAEVRAAWMALGLFCPEVLRKQFKSDLAKGHITDFGIASRLRLPEAYIPIIMGDGYDRSINQILDEC